MITDIDVLREQLVRHLVLLQYVVVGARAREGGAEEESEESACGSIWISCALFSLIWMYVCVEWRSWGWGEIEGWMDG